MTLQDHSAHDPADHDPAAHAAAFNASHPVALAQTPRASLWSVQHAGTKAVLKILTPEGKRAGEGQSAALLALWDGQGAVRLRASNDMALLMDFVGETSLGDVARGGEDDAAAHTLARVCTTLSRPPHPDFEDIADHGAALSGLDLNRIDAPHRALFDLAQRLWAHLLATAPAPVLLHGDLHHDNVLSDGTNWLAIDPKGLNGDPAYELANAFQNPLGMAQDVEKRDRFLRLADIFHERTGYDRDRLIGYAYTRVALSICWSLDQEADFPATPARLATYRSFLPPALVAAV